MTRSQAPAYAVRGGTPSWMMTWRVPLLVSCTSITYAFVGWHACITSNHIAFRYVTNAMGRTYPVLSEVSIDCHLLIGYLHAHVWDLVWATCGTAIGAASCLTPKRTFVTCMTLGAIIMQSTLVVGKFWNDVMDNHPRNGIDVFAVTSFIIIASFILDVVVRAIRISNAYLHRIGARPHTSTRRSD